MYENCKNIGEFGFTCPHVSQIGGDVSLLQLTCSIGSEVASRYGHDLNFLVTIEHRCMSLLTAHISSSVKCVFKLFAHLY